MGDQPLSATAVREILARAGLDQEVLAVRELGGGVSSDVYDVRTSDDRLVVKVALERLKVDDDWFASLSRAAVERRALALAGSWTPDHVPELLGWDTATGALVLRHAGEDVRPWKADLLAGRVETHVADDLAEVLASWQEHGSRGVDQLGPDSDRNVAALRTEPYYRTVARRLPELASPIDALVVDSSSRRECLVHGDFSPKNILVGRRTIVLDWEVAHLGDPTYDAAFLSSHLLLKSLARPAAHLGVALDAFLSALEAARPGVDWDRLWRHVGALVLSRIVGTSRVDYLSGEQADKALQVGRGLLLDPPQRRAGAADLIPGRATPARPRTSA